MVLYLIGAVGIAVAAGGPVRIAPVDMQRLETARSRRLEFVGLILVLAVVVVAGLGIAGLLGAMGALVFVAGAAGLLALGLIFMLIDSIRRPSAPGELTATLSRDDGESERLERAKTEFVAMASHELRSPLTSIKGFVELLERSSDNMTERQREFVDIIMRSTERLVDLVNDLLDVARIEADRVEIEPRPIDVGEAVRDVVELMEPRFAQKRQHLGVYIAPRMPLVLADPGRVRQIIANLLTNAHLYTEEGGRIHIGAEGERAQVQIVVGDSGVGLDEEERELVFERFYRAAASGSSPGTGLGLSIVKALVEMHHGRIEVDSVPGRGTTFTVLLPAAAPEISPPAMRWAVRGRRVLVVDDHPEVTKIIAEQLDGLEVEVAIATSGAQALELLATETFDAVMLDVRLAEMNGLELLRRIRAQPGLSGLPIVFVSSAAEEPELDGEWVLPEPIDPGRLRDVLGAAISSGRSRVLVVAREELQSLLEPGLDRLGIEHEWKTSGAAAARVCQERRFEVALIDVGVRNPRAVLQALDLRGRRRRRAVILFSDGLTPTPAGLAGLGMEVIPVEHAPSVVMASIGGDSEYRPVIEPTGVEVD